VRGLARGVRRRALTPAPADREETRKKSHKIKRYDPNADVDYINDRNRKFNEKIARAFDSYTHEIKGNLERGCVLAAPSVGRAAAADRDGAPFPPLRARASRQHRPVVCRPRLYRSPRPPPSLPPRKERRKPKKKGGKAKGSRSSLCP
jgi:hypothetical protein